MCEEFLYTLATGKHHHLVAPDGHCTRNNWELLSPQGEHTQTTQLVLHLYLFILYNIDIYILCLSYTYLYIYIYIYIYADIYIWQCCHSK